MTRKIATNGIVHDGQSLTLAKFGAPPHDRLGKTKSQSWSSEGSFNPSSDHPPERAFLAVDANPSGENQTITLMSKSACIEL